MSPSIAKGQMRRRTERTGVGWVVVLASLSTILGTGCGRSPEPRAPRPWPEDVPVAGYGSVVPAQSEAERSVLRQLGQLRAGIRLQVGGLAVTADEAYAAASGRICRRVTLNELGDHSGDHAGYRVRLACRVGEEWFYVPNVFAVAHDGGVRKAER